ncbi:uncharacterized protein LOC116342050 [Contarinia nasturtii]|uniref:uncharacterized protein LOC116342050 n=1 Tax=Contarinia nasturtii TaxID=265458 RepID=UPI0012D3C658|nr:uncharacterized protein LOC116342050 [Contarinia nasturtii]
MSQESDSFVSVFKIDGKPILPPVIDDARRIEISRDRQLAIDVEHRLRLQQQQKIKNSQSDLVASDYDETLVKGAIECNVSNYDTSAAVDSLLDDNISTLKEDVVDKIESAFGNIPSINVPNFEEKSAVNERKSSKNVPLSLIIDTNFNEFNVENISPSFSLHSSPSMGALDDSRNQSLYFTPMSGRESFASTPNSLFPSARIIRSNSFTLEKPSPMLLQHMEANGIQIGSNCSPLKSPRFLQVNEFKKTPKNTPQKRLQSHDVKDSIKIKEQKKKPNASKVPLNKSAHNKSLSSSSNTSLNSTILQSNHSVKSSSPYAVKSMKKQKSSTKPKQSNQTNGESGVFKNSESILRSIYEPSKPAKTPASAKKGNGSIASVNGSTNGKHSTSTRTPTKTSVEPISSRSSNISNGNFHDILAMIEHQHEAQMQMLVQRQQEEQMRMQAEFQRQQNELLLKISNLIANKTDNKHSTPNEILMTDAKKSNEKMLIEEVNNDVALALDTNGNRLFTRFTPENSKCMRRLYYDDNKLVSDELNKSQSIEGPSSLSTVSSDQLVEYTAREIAAATTIAAYTRGHQTRRLMKTKKVQTIVNTRRDSLLIALDMHYESKERAKNGTQTESETEADIELKSQLIQQLASASQNLHDIFVEISMAERMDIIAKDREWQRNKLNRSKLSNNNKNHMFVNGNSHFL